MRVISEFERNAVSGGALGGTVKINPGQTISPPSCPPGSVATGYTVTTSVTNNGPSVGGQVGLSGPVPGGNVNANSGNTATTTTTSTTCTIPAPKAAAPAPAPAASGTTTGSADSDEDGSGDYAGADSGGGGVIGEEVTHDLA